MLLDNQFLLINKLKISLTYDNNVSKSFIINVNDIIGVNYKQGNNTEYIKGKVGEINCNFNSSIGRIESSIFIKVDGSEEYYGRIVFIKPEHITDLNVFEVADTVINPVVSVNNDTQRILMIRENELGNFQYSKDGLTWHHVGEGPQGLSAYEVAVEFGFDGSELMWLESLKGRRGNTGPKGADGKNNYQIALDNGFVGTEEEWLESLKGEKGDIGNDGKSAYQVAVDNGFVGTEEEWLESLKGEKGDIGETGNNGKSAYQVAVDNGFVGTEEEWLVSLKGEKGNTGSKGATGKSAYQFALDNGFVGTEEEWVSSLKGEKGDIGNTGSNGTNGVDGKSAYQIAVDGGFTGTESEWLDSLKAPILNMSFTEQATGKLDPYGDEIYVRSFHGNTQGTGSQEGALLSTEVNRIWGYSGMIGTTGNKQPVGACAMDNTDGIYYYTAFPRVANNNLYLYHNFNIDNLEYDIEVQYTKVIV